MGVPIDKVMSKIKINAALASGMLMVACSRPEGSVASESARLASCQARSSEEIGGPFALVDHQGIPRTEDDFKGQYSLVFFGFTFCPDVCPATLVALKNALRLLPDDLPKPRTILISVDPERDTPAALAQYVETTAFPENLTGLTGSADAIKGAAEAFFVGYEKVDLPESLAGYTISHTSLVYLMDPNWKMVSFFLSDENQPDQVASCLAEHIRPISGD